MCIVITTHIHTYEYMYRIAVSVREVITIIYTHEYMYSMHKYIKWFQHIEKIPTILVNYYYLTVFSKINIDICSHST